jgi:hypothetical protein
LIDNQRLSLDKVGQSLGVKEGDLSPWYGVDQKALTKMGLAGLLREKYYTSHYAMLKKVYPEYNWLPWKFKALPKITYRDPNVVKQALEYIEQKCNVTKPEHWYRVSQSQLIDFGVSALISQNGGLYETLKSFRGDFPWVEENFAGVRYSGLKSLGAYLRRIWPDREVTENFTLSDDLHLVSFVVPSLSLAFDYQSPKDYVTGEVSGKTQVSLKIPLDKKASAERSNLTLIVVPFWWERTLPTLVGTILEAVPTLSSTMTNLSEWGETPPIPHFAVVSLLTWKRRINA